MPVLDFAVSNFLLSNFKGFSRLCYPMSVVLVQCERTQASLLILNFYVLQLLSEKNIHTIYRLRRKDLKGREF